MPAEFVRASECVRATCPECQAVTTFEPTTGGGRFGLLQRGGMVKYQGKDYGQTSYMLLRCAGCGRGGLATVLLAPNVFPALSDFYPGSRDVAPLPGGIPPGIVTEYREAELCASVSAYRAASAPIRSVLEKTLKANGYIKGSLEAKIDEAAEDGIITAARKRRAHEEIRVLGNDILHDEWRPVTADEYADAHRYAQRILEDFYDQRPQVEAILKAKADAKQAKS